MTQVPLPDQNSPDVPLRRSHPYRGASGSRWQTGLLNHVHRLMAAVLAVVLGVVPLTGCSSDSIAKGCQSYAGEPLSLAIVTGNHEGNPAPGLTDLSRPLVTRSLCNGTLDIVSSAGEPTKLTNDQFRLEKFGGTSSGNDDVLRRNLKKVTTALQLPPTADGANLVKAVGVAAAALRGRPAGVPRTILVIDNALPDRGPLATTQPGLLKASADTVVKDLTAKKLLPDLQGVTVLLSGVGATTAPQPALSDKAITNLISIATATLTAAGAEVQVDPTPRSGQSVPTNGKRVTPTPVPADEQVSLPVACASSETVFDGRSSVTFTGDQATFSHRAAAHAALQPLVEWLKVDPDRTAILRGTTVDVGNPDGQKRLGQKRADSVADYLVTQGVLRRQITTVGVGADFPEYLPDRTPSGELDETRAPANRSIRVLLADNC